MTLLEALLKVRSEGPKHRFSGICLAVIGVDREAYEQLLNLLQELTGERAYPVGLRRGLSAEERMREYHITRNLWDPNTPTGQERLWLLDQCIERLSTNL
jgi:hypothetical protein